MIAAYRFISTAADEASESLDYYNDISNAVGQEFMAELDRVIDLIRRFPETGVIVEEGFRSLPLRKFPYSLIYDEERRDSDRGGSPPKPPAGILERQALNPKPASNHTEYFAAI